MKMQCSACNHSLAQHITSYWKAVGPSYSLCWKDYTQSELIVGPNFTNLDESAGERAQRMHRYGPIANQQSCIVHLMRKWQVRYAGALQRVDSKRQQEIQVGVLSCASLACWLKGRRSGQIVDL